MRARDLSFDSDSLTVRPWVDPIIDDIGHDPRSTYVERFWLAVLGPSTTFLLRHLVDRLEAAPEGYELDLGECATALGLGRLQSAGAAFPRTVGRACQFGAARLPGGPVLEVRRRLPPLTPRQLRRLPRDRQAEHARWLEEAAASIPERDLRDQARRLALSIVELGEDRAATERQLRRWRFHPTLAGEATAWAITLHEARGLPVGRAAQEPARARREHEPDAEPSGGPADVDGYDGHDRSPALGAHDQRGRPPVPDGRGGDDREPAHDGLGLDGQDRRTGLDEYDGLVHDEPMEATG